MSFHTAAIQLIMTMMHRSKEACPRLHRQVVILTLAITTAGARGDICSIVWDCAPAGEVLKTWTSAESGADPNGFCFDCAGAYATGVRDSDCAASSPQGSGSAHSECGYPGKLHFRLQGFGSYAGGPAGTGAGGYATAGVGTNWVFQKPGASGAIWAIIKYRITSNPAAAGYWATAMKSNMFNNGNGCVVQGLNASGLIEQAFPAVQIGWNQPMTYGVGFSLSGGAGWYCAPCSTSADVTFEIADVSVTQLNGTPVNGFTVRDANTNAIVWPIQNCSADIAPAGTPDGTVNIDDLLAVINAWGPCANPNDCPADIAPVGGNDIVNIDDLLAVINAWGVCP